MPTETTTKKRSSGETAFLAALASHGADIPTPVEQLVFAKCIGRRWRFDFAWHDERVAVEVHGATFAGGRHNRGVGMAKDCEKMNSALVLGWRVVTFTTSMLKANPGACVAVVRAVLAAGK